MLGSILRVVLVLKQTCFSFANSFNIYLINNFYLKHNIYLKIIQTLLEFNYMANKVSALIEVFGFLKKRKKYWLIPLMLVLAVMGGTLVAVQGSAIAPFIYTLF